MADLIAGPDLVGKIIYYGGYVSQPFIVKVSRHEATLFIQGLNKPDPNNPFKLPPEHTIPYGERITGYTEVPTR